MGLIVLSCLVGVGGSFPMRGGGDSLMIQCWISPLIGCRIKGEVSQQVLAKHPVFLLTWGLKYSARLGSARLGQAVLNAAQLEVSEKESWLQVSKKTEG